MAQIVDAARPTEVTKNCATVDYGDTLDVGFVINRSAAESHIDLVVLNGQVVGVDNTSDTAAPILDMSGFWLASTPGTVR